MSPRQFMRSLEAIGFKDLDQYGGMVEGRGFRFRRAWASAVAAHIEGNLAGSGYGASAVDHTGRGGVVGQCGRGGHRAVGHVRRHRGHVGGVGGAT